MDSYSLLIDGLFSLYPWMWWFVRISSKKEYRIRLLLSRLVFYLI